MSIISRVNTIETIKKYTKKTINDNEALLHLYNFNSGEKIYISITTSQESADTKLYYKFYTHIIGVNSFSYEKSIDFSSKSYSYGDYTYNYKLKKEISNANYLYMSYKFTPPVTIENTKDDASITVYIYIVISCIVFIVIVISIIVCCSEYNL